MTVADWELQRLRLVQLTVHFICSMQREPETI